MVGIGMALEAGDGEAFLEQKVGHILGHESGGVCGAGLAARTAYLAPPFSRLTFTSCLHYSVKNLLSARPP